ncbi:MAG: hypothetical protein KUG79_09045 [Pseudomonadales bacterium]|nr:hypothetical protein [Pseudomonadales bacterium]
MDYKFTGKLNSEDMKEFAKYDFHNGGENEIVYGILSALASFIGIIIYICIDDVTFLLICVGGLGLIFSWQSTVDLYNRFLKKFDASDQVENTIVMTDDFVSIQHDDFFLKLGWEKIEEMELTANGVLVLSSFTRFFLPNRVFETLESKQEFHNTVSKKLEGSISEA